MTRTTDFSKHAHPQLYKMLHEGDPATVKAAGDAWADVARGLHERAGVLVGQLRNFDQLWDGMAAERYMEMIADLASGIRIVATTAQAVRDLAYTAGEALEDAQLKMPPPVAVPEISPLARTIAQPAGREVATASPESQSFGAALGGPGAEGMASAAPDDQGSAQVRAQLAAEVRQQQQAQAAAATAHQQAVQVMSQLADNYTAAEAAMPTVAKTGEQSMFGRMLPAGAAAATAAAAGLFARAVLGAPGLKGAAGPNAKTPAALASGLRGGGGGGGSAPPRPVANPALGSGSTSPGGLAAGVAAAAARAGMPGGMMPYMPMMPYGMGAGMGGDMGMSRRVPPWLVEHEQVWGESVAVSPQVIGEEARPEKKPWA